jgi:tRNA threonylcarbamoyladenosine biosynthesis protein TsaB
MTVLGIETATTTCAAAVVRDDVVLGEAVLEERHAHAAMLVSQIRDVLRTSGLQMKDLDGIAVSSGPGSFTGLRIGVTVAKGLAWGEEKKLAGVATLRALVCAATERYTDPPSGDILAVLDSRKDEVYVQRFRLAGGRPTEVTEVGVASPSALVERFGGQELLVVTLSIQFRAAAAGESRLRFLPAEKCRCSAVCVALEGIALFRSGRETDAATLEPEYVIDVRGTYRISH